MNFFTKKHPIATGVILIIAAFLVFRFSISNAQAGGGESTLWISLIALGFFIAGVLVLVGWWRNNISMMTTKHNVNWRNR